MAVTINVLNAGNMTLTTGGYSPAGHAETRVKYTEASGITPREQNFNIEGELTSNSIDNMANVEEVDIGNTVRSIGDFAFLHCGGLMSITIPSSITSIKMSAFAYCSGLTSVTILNSVTSIGEAVFEGCSGLKSLTFQGKTLAQIQKMDYYPWEIVNTSIINVA